MPRDGLVGETGNRAAYRQPIGFCALLWPDDVIVATGQFALLSAVCLSNETLPLVSNHRVAHFLRDCDSDSMRWFGVSVFARDRE